MRDSFAEAKARSLSVADPRGAVGRRVPRDHPPARRHADRMAGSSRACSDRSIIVGHGIFLDDHPSTRWHTDTDLALLAETGTTVAHCPTVFVRRGIALKDFGRYRRAGVQHGHRHRHLSAQHAGGNALRRLSRAPEAGNPRTLDDHRPVRGGDRSAARGRSAGTTSAGLPPGCKADLVLVDLPHPRCARRAIRCGAWSTPPANARYAQSIVDGEWSRTASVLTIDYQAPRPA